MASLALLALAAIVSAREITGGLAMSPFNRNVAGTFVRGAVVRIDRSGAVPRWYGFWEADGKWRPIPGDSSKALVVYYRPRARGDQPSMQVQLTGLFRSGAAVGPSLQEAANSGWVPIPAGGIVTCVEVSPDGHFPQRPPD